MKKWLILVLGIAVLSWAAMAQTSATSQTQGSAATGANATAGQSGADANANTGASATQDVNAAHGQSSAAGQAAGSTEHSAHASADTSGANAGLASGTTINAKLTKSLDSKKAKVGDAVEAKTTSDVKSEGKTVLPKGSKLLGKVTQTSARANGDAQSAVTIVFDRAVPKGGGAEMPLNLTIRALAAAQSTANVNNDDVMGGGGMGSTSSAGSPMGGSAPSGSAGSAGGLGSTVGGVGSTVGGVANTTGNTVGSTTGAVGSTVGATTRTATGAGVSATGELQSNAQGAIGLRGITLNQATSATQGATISSTDKSVHLDSGTQLVLEVAGGVANQ